MQQDDIESVCDYARYLALELLDLEVQPSVRRKYLGPDAPPIVVTSLFFGGMDIWINVGALPDTADPAEIDALLLRAFAGNDVGEVARLGVKLRGVRATVWSFMSAEQHARYSGMDTVSYIAAGAW